MSQSCDKKRLFLKICKAKSWFFKTLTNPNQSASRWTLGSLAIGVKLECRRFTFASFIRQVTVVKHFLREEKNSTFSTLVFWRGRLQCKKRLWFHSRIKYHKASGGTDIVFQLNVFVVRWC